MSNKIQALSLIAALGLAASYGYLSQRSSTPAKVSKIEPQQKEATGKYLAQREREVFFQTTPEPEPLRAVEEQQASANPYTKLLESDTSHLTGRRKEKVEEYFELTGSAAPW